MKKNIFDILNSSDELTEEFLSRFPAEDKKKMNELFAKSEQKYRLIKSGRNSRENKIIVTGGKKLPKIIRTVTAIAACAVLSVGISQNLWRISYVPRISEPVPAAEDAEITDNIPKISEKNITAAESAPSENNYPFGDLANDKIRFMTAAIAPYLMTVPEETQKKLAEAFDKAEWTETEFDPNEDMSGESETMFVYNNGKPYALYFLPQHCIKYDNGTEEKYFLQTSDIMTALYDALEFPSEFNSLTDADFLTYYDYKPTDNIIEAVWEAVDKAEKQSHPRNPAPDMDTKEGILNAMLNSIDHYDKASGRIIIGDRIDSGICTYNIVDFDTDLDTGRSYSYLYMLGSEYTDISDFEKASEGNDFENDSLDHIDHISITSTDGKYGYDFDPLAGTFTLHDCFTRKNGGEYRTWQDTIFTAPDGSVGHGFRCKITNTAAADSCLAPFETAAIFLEKFDSWDIEYEEMYKGRKCAVIKGICERNDWKSFVLYVDKVNGTLLRFKIYNTGGELVRFLWTDDISFDDAAEEIRRIDLTEFKDDLGDSGADKPGFVRYYNHSDRRTMNGENYISLDDLMKLDPEGDNTLNVYSRDCETVIGQIDLP